MSSFFDSPWRRRAATALGCVALVYGMVYVDVVLRARSAFQEGEKYLAWHANPDAKKAHFEAEFRKKTDSLQRLMEKGKIDRVEFDERIELAEFERDHGVGESSVKYAYLWFQTAVELFSPPESSWVKRSRVKMSEAKELWKQELTQKGIPFEDYMLE